MPQICVGKIGDGGKIDQQRQFEFIGNIHSAVDSVVIETTLRSLHPVDDAGAVGFGKAGAANGHARIGSEILESGRRFRALSFFDFVRHLVR